MHIGMHTIERDAIGSQTGDGRIDTIWLDMRRQKQHIDAEAFEQRAPRHRRAHGVNRMAEDGEQARARIGGGVEAGAVRRHRMHSLAVVPAGLIGLIRRLAHVALRRHVSRNARLAAPHSRPRSTGGSAAYSTQGASTPSGMPGGSASSNSRNGSAPALAPG